MKLKNILFSLITYCCCAFSFFSCSSDDSGSLDIVLQADNQEIIADGTTEVSFTVTLGGEVITQNAEIYNGTEKLAGNKFTTNTVGDYKFIAKYEGAFSNEIVINAAEVEALKKRALLTVWSSTNCSVCPYMASQRENNWEPNKGGDFVTLYFYGDFGQKEDCDFVIRDEESGLGFVEGGMASWFNCIGGYPKAKLDAEYDITYMSEYERFDLVLENKACADIAIESSIEGDKLKVKVLTTARGNYPHTPGLAIWLKESKLISPQAYRNPETELVEVINDYEHNHVVRDYLTPDDFGIEIPQEYRTDGKEFIYETIYTIPTEFKKENLSIVAYVYQDVPRIVSDGGHQVNNVVEVKAGGSIDYQLK